MNDSLLVAAPLMIGAIVMTVRFVGCGLAGPTSGNGVVVSVTGDVSGRGGLSATVSFPENKPVTQEYTVAGAYTYEIPYWCSAIDLILLGAGGGGTYGGINNGVGGGAGSWKTATLESGPDTPWATTTISIAVGHGGAPGAASGASAMAGGNTTAGWESSSGPTTETASGGGAGAATAPVPAPVAKSATARTQLRNRSAMRHSPPGPHSQPPVRTATPLEVAVQAAM
jgi:hypothetical protein